MSTTRSSEGGELLKLSVAARAIHLREIRNALRTALHDAGAGEGWTADTILAVDEACQNIIRHAYGGETDAVIDLEVRREGPNILLYLRDFADPVNVDNIRSRDLEELRPGGLGVHFIREVMDEVEYRPLENGEGNLLRMVKRIA